MISHDPLISVIIPSYNHEHFIEETIRSIWAQPYKSVEVIVVDDRSDDNSVALLERLQHESPFPMDVSVNNTRSGPAATLNRAIPRAKGELLALFASDDLYSEDGFSRRIEMFRDNPELQIVYANGTRFDGRGPKGLVHDAKVAQLLAREPNEILEYLYTHTSPLFLQTALIKASLMRAIGGYDEDVKADDWVINTKIFAELSRSGGRHAYVDEPVFLYRLHDSNLHRDTSRHIALKLQYIQKYTPERLKNAARANIVYGLSLQALRSGNFGQAISLFRQSQAAGLNLKKTVRFARKLLVGATFGTVRRQLRKSLLAKARP